MSRHFAAIAYTPAVRACQRQYAGAELDAEPVAAPPALGPREGAHIAARDSFYLATVGETGWPHVQHRGGAPGFLKLLDPGTLAFADYCGNRQYVSTGNIAQEARVALILVDYPNRRRLKILGRAEIIDPADAPPGVFTETPTADTQVERIVVIRVAAFDWNCSRHITPRYTEDEWLARHPAARP